jgi:hypothetical protein
MTQRLNETVGKQESASAQSSAAATSAPRTEEDKALVTTAKSAVERLRKLSHPKGAKWKKVHKSKGAWFAKSVSVKCSVCQIFRDLCTFYRCCGLQSWR